MSSELNLSPLVPETDISVGSWVIEAVGECGTVGCVVPAVFQDYASVFHPARRGSWQQPQKTLGEMPSRHDEYVQPAERRCAGRTSRLPTGGWLVRVAVGLSNHTGIARAALRALHRLGEREHPELCVLAAVGLPVDLDRFVVARRERLGPTRPRGRRQHQGRSCHQRSGQQTQTDAPHRPPPNKGTTIPVPVAILKWTILAVEPLNQPNGLLHSPRSSRQIVSQGGVPATHDSSAYVYRSL